MPASTGPSKWTTGRAPVTRYTNAVSKKEQRAEQHKLRARGNRQRVAQAIRTVESLDSLAQRRWIREHVTGKIKRRVKDKLLKKKQAKQQKIEQQLGPIRFDLTKPPFV